MEDQPEQLFKDSCNVKAGSSLIVLGSQRRKLYWLLGNR